jgi:pimeloyl-ACP methyl ester carboxylesterase
VAPSVVRLSHAVVGPPDGLPVILLHGSPANRSMWDAQARELAAQGYRVVLPDLRGHGQSPVPHEPSTMERCAADVWAMADGLGLRQFVLGGLSFGGMVALEMVTASPERISGLLLAATVAEPDSERQRKARLEVAEAVRQGGIAPDVDRMLPRLFSQATYVERPGLIEQVRAMMLTTPPEGRANAIIGITQRGDYRPLLPKVRAPTLVLVGAEDAVTTPEQNKDIHKRVPGAFLQVLEGAGHLCNLEAPGTFNQAMMNWLAFFESEL